MAVPVPDEVPRPRQRRAIRHESFLNRLATIGTKRDPAWAATAAGLRLVRFLDSWVVIGPDFMRGDAPVLQLREGVEAINDHWADLRVALLSAYDSLAFIDVPAEVQLSISAIRAGWMRAVLSLADAADCYEQHGYPDLALAVHSAVLGRMPPADEKRATKRTEMIEQLANRSRAAVERLASQAQ
ncbi:MAG: hypothetical protein ACR2M1_15155 [Gemmatimonadaceae bacterium]